MAVTPSSPPAIALALLGALGLMPLLADGAQALPDYQGGGQQNVEGVVPGSNAAIRVVGERGLVRWHSFSVAPGEVFRIEGNPSQAILNLVSGPDASRIGGLIESGPRFLLSNPNGIEILGSGRIVAPGVWLTTGRIDSEAWLNRSGVYAGQANDYLHISLDRPNAINLEGTVLASDGSRGGSIGVFAESIHLGNTARLEANGPAGGGQILVGGSWQNQQAELHSAQAITTVVDHGAVLEANATTQGDGGTIVIWSDITNPNSRTRVDGTLHARGGPQGGNGGRIETSGYWLGVDDIQISTEAPLGLSGEWLLDPYDIVIGNTDNPSSYSISGDAYTATSDDSQVSAASIGTALGLSNVSITTGVSGSQTGTIRVTAPITKASGGPTTTLTLQAAASIDITSDIGISDTGLNLIISTESGSGTISGNLNLGTGQLIKQGSGTTILTGTNSYSGATSISAGTLAIGNGSTTGTLGTGAVTNNAALIFNRSDALTIPNAISGTGSITKSGAGTTTFTGSNTYTGTTTISAGTLAISNGSTTGTLGTGAVTNNAMLIFNRSDVVPHIANAISGTGTVENSGSGRLTLSGNISGTISITNSGTDRLTLSGNNTYSGGTIISRGTLYVSSSSALGTGSVINNASLSLLVGSGSGSYTISNTISGNGSVTKGQSTTIILTGENTYTGTTTINNGKLVISGSLHDTTAVTIATGATYEVASTDTVGSIASAITGTGSIVLGDGHTLTAGGLNTSTTFSGVMSGAGSFVKAGSGTTTFTGSNTYTGTTTISAGTLAIGNGSTTGTLGTGAVTNNAALIFNRSNALAVANAISGTGSITQHGTGTTTLTGSNSYSGGTTLNAGTLNLGSANAIGSSGTINLLGGTLQFSAANTADYSARFSSAANQSYKFDTNSQVVTFSSALNSVGGALAKLGLGTLTLRGNNSYSGGTTISGGSLAIGDGSTSGTLGTGAVINNAALIFNRSDALAVANAISGTGSITQSGAGTTTLTGSNNYSGTTTISNGTLAIGNGSTSGTLGTGSVTNNAALIFNRSDALAVANAIAGTGSITQSGTGTTTLSGNSSYTGTTTLNAGTLNLGSANAIGSSGTINPLGGILQFSANNTTDYSARFSSAANQVYNVDTNGQSVSFDTALNSVGGALTKLGLGTLTLTGNNTYTGTTTISAGTLTIGNASTSGALGTGAVTNNASLIFNRSGALTVANAISGTGSITQSGIGTTTLTGSNTYTGTTTISAGTLAIGNGSTTGTLGTGAVTNNAALIFHRSDALAVANAISGTGSITQSGAGTTTLTGNNTYTGSTILSSGTLALGSANALGSVGTIEFLDGILQFSAANTNDYSSRFSTAANQFFAIDTNGQSVTLASALTSSGGALNKLGLGTLTLTGNNTYTGGTTITAGTLAIGNGSTSGTLGTGAVTNNAALIFNRSDALTVANAISGTGSITQSGAGTTTLTGNNTYTGSTILSSGTLALGSANALGSVGTIEFLDGILQFSAANTNDYSARFSTAANQFFAIDTNGQSVTLASALTSSGGALNKLGLGTLTLTGNNTYTGGTTITAGTLAIGNGSTSGTLGTGAVTNNAALIFNRSDALTVANAISGTGSITQSGAGTTTLTGDNTYTGTTTLSSGSVALGSANALGSTGTISLLGGTLQFSAANTTDYSARFSSEANQAYIIDTNGQAVTFASALTSTGGALTKLGLGTLTLTANNTYTGATLVQAGFLSVLGRGPTSATCTGGSSNLCGSSPTPSPVSAAGLAAANTAAIGTRSNTGNAFDRGALNSTAPPLPLAAQPEQAGRSSYSFLVFNRDGAMNAEASDQTDRPPSP